MNYILSKSNRKNKKYQVTIPDNKIIHFGDSRYEDFTTHKDPGRKENYLKRHTVSNDLNTASFWAANLLWNKSSLSSSIKDIEKRFNIRIKFK